mgnify:FL=1
MAYIGTPAVDRFTASKAASVYSGDGSTTAFTLEHAVGSDEDILVSVDGVIQEPSVAYAVSSGTTLTFTGAPSSDAGNNIFVYYLFRTIGTVTHPATSALTATSGTFTGAFTSLGIDDNADATAMTIDSSERVNIGTGTPPTADSVLTVQKSSAANEFNVISSPSHASVINLGDTDDYNICRIKADNSNNSLTFQTNNTSHMVIDSTGAITKPLQPAFLVHPASRQSNVADDTTLVFGTERFDQNGDFASNTFTAPVTGKYQLQIAARIDNIDTAANFCRIVINTSNKNYVGAMIDTGVLSADPGEWNFNFSVLADMDANDTSTISWSQSAGADQADVETDCMFSGYLVA